MSKRVMVLGSTGSIGTQALEVIADCGNDFTVVGLSAGGSSIDLLAQQIRETGVKTVAVADLQAAENLAIEFPDVQVHSGPEGATTLVDEVECEVVLNAIVGSRGLGPTLAALRHGRRLALANKESLVAGGRLVTKAAEPGQIVPVDSEHSALAQCLRSGTDREVERLVITASGGPFHGRSAESLKNVTPQEAGAHPTWDMGPMITLNSATLVNKSLEVIEAHLLFEIEYDRIDVTVHRQSIIHSMVTFIDGATIAQASPPSMKLPIALALGWPDRVAGACPPVDFSQSFSWTFEPVDHEVFPALTLARQVGKRGGLLPAVYNAANEQSAQAFLDGRIAFPAIVETIEEIVESAKQWTNDPRDIEDVLAAEKWARTAADAVIIRKAQTTGHKC